MARNHMVSEGARVSVYIHKKLGVGVPVVDDKNKKGIMEMVLMGDYMGRT